MAKKIKKNEKLIDFFKAQPLTKYAIAKKMNVTNRTIYNWIDGVSCPNVQNMEALAEACNVPFETVRNLFK